MATKTMSITGQLIEAFATTWSAIKKNHPDVPTVVITMASGTLGAKPGQVRYGHFAASRWQHDTNTLPELFISGEGLQRGAVDVLGVLLHEAAHGVADARQVKDTSRQGRYHNRKFKEIGEELGLQLTEDPKLGWSATAVPSETEKRYARQVVAIQAALVAYRHAEVTMPKEKKSTNLLVATCHCPRKIRVARATLDEAPIICAACDSEFVNHDD